jgi:hypothetical protein
MAHPSDTEARERYAAFLVAQVLFASDLPIPNETLGHLIDAARVGVATDFDKAIAGGCMAGDMLLVRIEMNDADVADAGVDKAAHIGSEYYGGFHNRQGRKTSKGFITGEGKPIRAGRETVLNNWKQYGNAAHLWGAYLILLREAEANGIRNDPTKWLDGHKLASIAMGLKQLAASAKRVRGASTALSELALEIVGATPPRWMLVPELTDDFKAALATFRPRIQSRTKVK